MEWTVVTVLIALLGGLGAIMTPVIRLNNNITRLTVCVASLQESLKDLTGRNKATHERLFRKQEECEATLSDHETRITVLERKEGQDSGV